MGLCNRLTTVTMMLALLAVAPHAEAAKKVRAAPDVLESAKAAIRVRDYSKAISELARLAAAGNADAEYLLAVLYLNGLGVAPDTARARTLLEQAATAHNARAAFSLSNLLASADPPDPQGAKRWFDEARRLGSTAAEQAAKGSSSTSARFSQPDLKDPVVRREAAWLASAAGDLATVGSPGTELEFAL